MFDHGQRSTWVAVNLLAVLGISYLITHTDAANPLSFDITASGAAIPIPLTLVRDANLTGAVCLDGSLPAYHLDPGSGYGLNRWIIHLQGGAWCVDSFSCAQRSQSVLGSSRYMNSTIFQGILSSSFAENPAFYNWNRVKVRYCDGGSFSGNVDEPMLGRIPGTNQFQLLYYRGERIWEAVINDLLAKGLNYSVQAILSGESAGGLASFIHCNSFKQRMPVQADIRCISDGGFFLDIPDVNGDYLSRNYFKNVVTLQNISYSLSQHCTAERDPAQCFFPQYFLTYIDVPMFIIQSAYDTYQIRNTLIPSSLDPNGTWTLCKTDPSKCSAKQLKILQGFRSTMVVDLIPSENFSSWGLYLISCFYHTQSQADYLWNGQSRVANKNVMQAVGDWVYKGENDKYIDCQYPCNPTCIGVS